jgi:hypothetical protein
MFAHGLLVTFELWLVPTQAPSSAVSPASLLPCPSEQRPLVHLASDLKTDTPTDASSVPREAVLIAADVGFPSGHSFYVATRFSSKRFRNLAPGFILALASARTLSQAGYLLWDLGDTDSSPMMAYKQEVAIEEERPYAVARLRRLRALPGLPARLPLGQEINSRVAADDLFKFEEGFAGKSRKSNQGRDSKADRNPVSGSVKSGLVRKELEQKNSKAKSSRSRLPQKSSLNAPSDGENSNSASNSKPN